MERQSYPPMKVLIVAKTRRGGGACIGGITLDGRSVRLQAANQRHRRTGKPGLPGGRSVGSDGDAATRPDPTACGDAGRLRPAALANMANPLASWPSTWRQSLAASTGLYDGLLQTTHAGALYIAARTGLPGFSTCFWRSDQPLRLDTGSKRVRYRYPTGDGGRTLVFVGFQEPIRKFPRAHCCASRWRTGGGHRTVRTKNAAMRSCRDGSCRRRMQIRSQPARQQKSKAKCSQQWSYPPPATVRTSPPADAASAPRDPISCNNCSRQSSASTAFARFRPRSSPACAMATTRWPFYPQGAASRSAISSRRCCWMDSRLWYRR